MLTDLRLALWVRSGREEAGAPCLAERVTEMMANPAASRRFGVLALGESTHLVDELRQLRAGDLGGARPLVADPDGDLSLTLWPNHVGSRGTAWGQYRLAEKMAGEMPQEEGWIAVRR